MLGQTVREPTESWGKLKTNQGSLGNVSEIPVDGRDVGEQLDQRLALAPPAPHVSSRSRAHVTRYCLEDKPAIEICGLFRLLPARLGQERAVMLGLGCLVARRGREGQQSAQGRRVHARVLGFWVCAAQERSAKV